MDGADSVYAQSVSKPGGLSANDSPRLLVDRGTDGSAETINDREVRPSVSPQASAVEAIPTPTAFHAGVLLLGLIALGRFVRRLRWA